MSEIEETGRGQSEERFPGVARVAAYGAALLAVGVGGYALYLIRSVLFLFLVAVLIATAIEPLVLRVRRGPFSRGRGSCWSIRG